jgi:hypothetical protein
MNLIVNFLKVDIHIILTCYNILILKLIFKNCVEMNSNNQQHQNDVTSPLVVDMGTFITKVGFS